MTTRSSSPRSTPARRASGSRRADVAMPYHAVERSDIFAMVGSSAASGFLQQPAPALESVLGDLSLMGIVWGPTPVAIITNRKDQQTFRRMVGEYLGELEIVAMTQRAVTVRYKNEEGRLE